MPAPDFAAMQSRLLRSGVSPHHVERTLLELRDHFDDLVDAAKDGGADRRTAEQLAIEELGDLDDISAAICERGELRSWAADYPRLALVVYPLACAAMLPAVPVIVGVANASYVGRWLGCALVSALVTASILLVLQLSITLT